MRVVDPRPQIRRSITGNAVVLEREHWDGATDVKVSPDPIAVKAKPSWGDWLRLMEFEDAGAELRQARTSGDRNWVLRADYRFRKAQEAMTKQVRFGERTQEMIRRVY